jgi:hypothetical protein
MTEAENRGEKSEGVPLNESAFRDIHPEELPQYIKEAKTVVMEGLREHLQRENDASEWESLAFSLGTLSELERIVQRWRGGTSTRR